MKKIILSLIISVISCSTVNASTEKPPSYEDMYPEWGYTSINEALSEVEDAFNKELRLPSRVPPIIFTHYFGKFDEPRRSFHAQYVNDRTPANHYKIDVRAAEDGIDFHERQVVDTYKLKNGATANYISLSQHHIGFHALVFNKDEWQYILSVDKRVAATVTPEVLVEIANSIENG
ncbi:hypothetical protein [Virgibacillus halodenitrificans]|uniref:hypothetical protein n=1 Tax=Virgibacillus halodenitrificans TaxID=1482 RepID=UPI0009F83D3D|nr:hypothetical protein [Virgibacillus halodenitrificans]